MLPDLSVANLKQESEAELGSRAAKTKAGLISIGGPMIIFPLIALAATAAVETPDQVVLSSTRMGRLAQACEGAATDLRESYCTGFILGAFDALSIAGAICPSAAEATTISAIAATRKYIADHPEEWSEPPIAIVMRALEKTFPCRRKISN